MNKQLKHQERVQRVEILKFLRKEIFRIPGISRFHEAYPHLLLQARHSCGIMLQNQTICPHLRERIKVLTQQQNVHHVLGLGPTNLFAKLRHGSLQSLHDRLPLPRHTQTRQIPGLCLCLGILHLTDLVGLGLMRRRLLETSRRVDFIHRRLYLGIGSQIRHEGIHNAVPIIFHHILKLLQHGVGDVILGFEGLVELQTRDG
mmetsp:Transcript_15510/g.20032  ORF Transcript_15510/g.20032 Transcript_15510/m.20032 type:complete len:202 (+) Transcript_15510:358-963(+)